MDVGSLFVAHPQAPELVKPGESPFYYPSETAQSASVLCVALSQQRFDMAGAQAAPYRLRVVGAVAKNALGTEARPSPLTHQRWDRIYQQQGLRGIMTICTSKAKC